MIIIGCKKCPLHKTRSNIVIGRGDIDKASILFIGEAPGVSEDMLGKSFIGESGKLLDRMIKRAGIPAELCYFTNTVFCRPCDAHSGPNREPKKAEIFACIPNIQLLVSHLKYTGVVVVGTIAKTYYGTRFPGVPITSITHPAAILRCGGECSSLFIDNVHKLRRFYESI